MLIVWMWVCNNNHLCPHHSVLIFWWMLKGKDSITLSMEFHTLVKNELYISRFHEKHNFNHNFTIITPDTTCIIKQCTNTSSPCFHLQPRQMKCIHKNPDNLLWSSFSPKTINYQKFYYTPHRPTSPPPPFHFSSQYQFLNTKRDLWMIFPFAISKAFIQHLLIQNFHHGVWVDVHFYFFSLDNFLIKV